MRSAIFALLLALFSLVVAVGCSDDKGSSGSDDVADDSAADQNDAATDVQTDSGDRPLDLFEEPDQVGDDAPVDVIADLLADVAADIAPDVPLPDPLAPLPEADNAEVANFETAEICGTCHEADEEDGVMVDGSGRDVSQSGLWPASIMGQAARDIYHIAAFSHELEAHPEAKALIDFTCTRCHAPAASAALAQTEAQLTFEGLTSGVEDADHLARDGVTCNACHQITDDGLGNAESFTGGFVTTTDRVSFGPFEPPDNADVMANVSGYQPVQSEHMTDSAFCATCHTVITRSLDETGAPTGPLFYEQVPYLEWRNSVFNDEVAEPDDLAAGCASCHQLSSDRDGELLDGPVATLPSDLPDRQPQGRHDFLGGNVYMLELMASSTDWSGTDARSADLLERAEVTLERLQTAAAVEVSLAVETDTIDASVRVINLTGHKFPTAFPTRRAWLHVALLGADDAVLWASGRWNNRGDLVDAEGNRLDELGTVLPHRDAITAEDQVQVYESVMVDADGEPTHVLLDAEGYAKDNRLLPLGWSIEHADAGPTEPIGVAGDDNFGDAADDVVTYRLPRLEGALALEVTLAFQSVPPYASDLLADHPTPATVRFQEMLDDQPPIPEVVTRERVTIE